MKQTSHISLCVALAVALSACATQPPSVTPGTSATSTGADACSHVYEPVCGTDGSSYDNACVAKAAGATIARQGSCTSPTGLTADERKYLVWLLNERHAQKLPDAPIIHVKTVYQPCVDVCIKGKGCDSSGCYALYYYGWGQPQTQVRIKVQNGNVTSAVDTSGYDYLTHTQGQPQSFPELQQ